MRDPNRSRTRANASIILGVVIVVLCWILGTQHHVPSLVGAIVGLGGTSVGLLLILYGLIVIALRR